MKEHESTSVSGKTFGHKLVKILVFPSLTGFMLTSFGFSLLNQGISCSNILHGMVFYLKS